MLLNQKRIFIIEDNANNRMIMQLLVGKAGGLTAIEAWGKESIAQIRAFMPVDLIILDLNLPDNVSGFEVFNQIQGETDLAHIPVLAVSAMDPSIAIPIAQAQGFWGFIPKPVGYARFAQQIATILKGEELWLNNSYD